MRFSSHPKGSRALFTIHPIRPTLSLYKRSTKQIPGMDVCISVGGEWSFRTYDQWYEVVSWLIEKGYSVSLVGSENGVCDAARISENHPSVRSTVGCLSLKEVCIEVAKAKVFTIQEKTSAMARRLAALRYREDKNSCRPCTQTITDS